MRFLPGTVCAFLLLALGATAAAEVAPKPAKGSSKSETAGPPLIAGKGLPDTGKSMVRGKDPQGSQGAGAVSATTWIVTDAKAKLIGPGADLTSPFGYVHVLNLSAQAATPSIQYFNYTGTFDVETSVANTERFGSVPSGGTKTLMLRAPDATHNRTGWMIVQSNVPVILYAYEGGMKSGGGTDRERGVPAFPLDCANPAGFEYACTFLAKSVTVD